MVQLKTCLNDSISYDDQFFGKELKGIPNDRDIGYIKDYEDEYNQSHTGYKFRCGKRYSLHKDSRIFLMQNPKVMYDFSFFEIRKDKSMNLILKREILDEIIQEFMIISDDISAFLSIRAGYEVIPIFYEYEIVTDDYSSKGFLIPLSHSRRLRNISYSLTNTLINFKALILSILECVPLDSKLSRSLQHLKLTTYDTPAELKLMAACSSLEYLYSYWFRNLNGYQKLVQFKQSEDFKSKPRNFRKNIDKIKLENFDPKIAKNTPSLTTLIAFFLYDLEINSSKYSISWGDSPQFITVRNNLLHGGHFVDEIEISIAQDNVCLLAMEVLLTILEKLSLSENKQIYSRDKIRNQENEFYLIPMIDEKILKFIF
ncbi:hypothetical protein FEK30_09295 [Picosynechococcus sp. PCC 11901]|uniref:hypothetical protein n=1 Tax=Picosynechococcus sp. PCC 11901 TaxID=2579791 RepID=UPI0010FC2AA2|nr:hypothetical protein [Picosynechococcus sp. PCC 11901]QCS49619.1 hypothetical protein FEK30_09295 [Picosynechococcus sp. PCC 11901]